MIEDKIKYNDYWERVQEKDKEIERLHSIIKEVREYVENEPLQKGTEAYRIGILEILEKES